MKQNGGCYVNAKRRSVKRQDFLKNWDLYLNFPKILQCGAHDLPPYDPNGEDAKYSFLCLENGYKVLTKDIEILRKVLNGKMSVNLQIKLWAEDIGVLLMPDELYSYCKDYPLWAFNATMEQAKQRIVKELGFVPTFMTYT
jgi:hypothetical protein